MKTRDKVSVRPGMTVLTPGGRVVTIISIDTDGYASVGELNAIYIPNTTATEMTRLIREVEDLRNRAMSLLELGVWEEAGMEFIRLARRCGNLSDASGLRVNVSSGKVCFHPYISGDLVQNVKLKKIAKVTGYYPDRIWRVHVCVTSSGKKIMDTWHEDDCVLMHAVDS